MVSAVSALNVKMTTPGNHEVIIIFFRRQQMLEHFAECIKMSKGQRQEAIQINVFTALLLALRTLAELKSSLGQDAVKTAATELIIVSYVTFSETYPKI